MKKYSIILADPPWNYNDKRQDKRRYGGKEYSTLSIKELCDLPIRDLADIDCALFMWVTMPLLEDCFAVIKAWGFRYATCGFAWVKINKNSLGGMFLSERDIRSGLGSYTNSNVELCLIGVKGKCLQRQRKDIKQVIFKPVERHSQKPIEAMSRIVQLYGDLPRIELFARQKVDGWDCWGNEVESDIEL